MREFKIGEKVCTVEGEGRILEIKNGHSLYPITVLINRKKCLYTSDGKKWDSDKYPSLFHLDEKPKQWRKTVKKKITMWANIDADGRVTAFSNRDQSFNNLSADNIRTCVEMTATYEVEE